MRSVRFDEVGQPWIRRGTRAPRVAQLPVSSNKLAGLEILRFVAAFAVVI
jgi:hypothetical protein